MFTHHGVYERLRGPNALGLTYVINVVARDHLFDRVSIARFLLRCCASDTLHSAG